MFDINITTVIQLVNFIITLVVLDFLLIKPVRSIIQKRRGLASAMIAETEDFSASAKEKLENYEAALAKAKEEAASIRERMKEEAGIEEGKILQTASLDAQAFLQDSRAKIQEASVQALAELKRDVPVLAEKISIRLTGKSKSALRA